MTSLARVACLDTIVAVVLLCSGRPKEALFFCGLGGFFLLLDILGGE